MEHSEQAWANDFIHEVTCPNGNKSILVRPSMKSERMGIPEFNRGPMIGEHTKEILSSLGYSTQEINDLKTINAVKCK
jgi:crotonobetainyl-CoA:carnitine CoA-transferase CaiB-like acyl-CoA transferase